jgi:hypothetical protein
MDGAVPLHLLGRDEVRLADTFGFEGTPQHLPPQARAILKTEGGRHLGESQIAFHILQFTAQNWRRKPLDFYTMKCNNGMWAGTIRPPAKAPAGVSPPTEA